MIHTIKPQLVGLMPDKLEEGILYVSAQYGTAIHKCCCGCGEKVVISLKPLFSSVQMKCKSHYNIKANQVEWL
jgi:hypothetical protein